MTTKVGQQIQVTHDYFDGFGYRTEILNLVVESVNVSKEGTVYGIGISSQSGGGFDWYEDGNGGYRHGRRYR